MTTTDWADWKNADYVDYMVRGIVGLHRGTRWKFEGVRSIPAPKARKDGWRRMDAIEFTDAALGRRSFPIANMTEEQIEWIERELG